MNQFMFSFNTQPDFMADIFFESPFEGFDNQALGSGDESNKKDVSTEESGNNTISDISSVVPEVEQPAKGKYSSSCSSIPDRVQLTDRFPIAVKPRKRNNLTKIEREIRKKEKDRLRAKRNRMKKKLYIQELEEKIQKLTAENLKMKKYIDRLSQVGPDSLL
jgi:uncharacterized protein YbcI